MKFLAEKYVGFDNKKVNISDEDLTESKLKKTILKTCRAYHSDKSANSGFTKEQKYLREQIMRILTNYINEMKGH